MINEELKKGLVAVGIKVADNATNEDAIKLLKANKKVLKAHDDLNVAITEGPVEQQDPSQAETTPPSGEGSGDPEVKATTPATPPAEENKETVVENKTETEEKPTTPAEPPKVPAATPVTPAPVADAPKRKFGKAFPNR